MKVFLEMNQGRKDGCRYELPLNMYRAICRRETDTGQTITMGEDFPLGPDERALIKDHLRRRKNSARVPRTDPSPTGLRRGSDILLEDQLISRTHAMVFLDGEGPSLVDLGSTNGTFVNAQAVTDADLVDGDVIHIGRARFIVHVEM